jgi:hypothetical protein
MSDDDYDDDGYDVYRSLSYLTCHSHITTVTLLLHLHFYLILPTDALLPRYVTRGTAAGERVLYVRFNWTYAALSCAGTSSELTRSQPVPVIQTRLFFFFFSSCDMPPAG